MFVWKLVPVCALQSVDEVTHSKVCVLLDFEKNVAIGICRRVGRLSIPKFVACASVLGVDGEGYGVVIDGDVADSGAVDRRILKVFGAALFLGAYDVVDDVA